MENKVIVITGASSGIGAAVARQLGAQGHKLVLAARRENLLKEVAQQSGTEALVVVTDVTRKADVENLKVAALDRFDHVDVWVNNAGQGIGRKVMDLTEAELDQVFAINLKSAFYGMKTIIPHFQSRGRCHLINVSSFLGRVPFVTARAAYNAAKAALNMLTANLRMDLAAEYRDIHVSLVMPGVVATDFAKNVMGEVMPFRPVGSSIKPQSAEEAAAAMVELIRNPAPEIYTNPALADMARRYYDNVAVFEDRLRHRD